MKRILLILISMVLICCGIAVYMNRKGVNSETLSENMKIRIGLSQVDTMNPWRVAQITSFINAAINRDYELLYNEEEDITKDQLKEVKQLLGEKIDYLVLAPVDSIVLEKSIELCNAADVKLILLECETEELQESEYLTLVSTDYYKEGQICAELLEQLFDGKSCNILMIEGSENSVVAQKRQKGFEDEASMNINMNIKYRIEGNFDRVTAQKSMENVIADFDYQYDAIFACSDEDGLGALQALKIAGKSDGKIPIVSINGVQDVLKAIIANEYYATVESSANIGEVIMQIIALEEAGHKTSKRVFIPYRVYDKSNAAKLFTSAY